MATESSESNTENASAESDPGNREAVPARVGVKGGKVGKGNPPADTMWKPGQSGNPAGRPKLLSMAYNAWLAQDCEVRGFKGMTNAEWLAAKAGKKAGAKSDPSLLREIRQATEGDKVTHDFKAMDDATLLQRLDDMKREMDQLLAAGGPAPDSGEPDEAPLDPPIDPEGDHVDPMESQKVAWAERDDGSAGEPAVA